MGTTAYLSHLVSDHLGLSGIISLFCCSVTMSHYALDSSACAGLQAVGLVGTTAYLSYLVSDHLGLSGIVSLFCCSVTMSHYALHSLSKSQRAATLSSFETLSYLAEGSIFVYVGLDALDPEKWAVSP